MFIYILNMNILSKYQQSKTLRSNESHSECDISLYEFENLIHYISKYTFDFHRLFVKNKLTITHGFTINVKNGDIDCYYQITTENLDKKKNPLNKNKKSRNNFNNLNELVENGFYKGEKRNGYWGNRYQKNLTNLIQILIDKLQPFIENEHYKKYNYFDKHQVNPLFDLLVNFHLDKKKIKAHDSVYKTIINEYPKQKWFKNNDNKFLPAVLDSYGIKSKYLIGEINKLSKDNINIKTLNYICKLFGENYIDYIKKFDWLKHTNKKTYNKKIHVLKDEYEKNSMSLLIKDWEKLDDKENIIQMINELLSIREFLENKGMKIKFNAKNFESFEILFEDWTNLKNHYKRGYRVRYTYPDYFLYEIESDIKIKDKIFEVKILKTEEDFNIEGYVMKNCMKKEFKHGTISIYISMKHEKKRINLQYKNGNLIQMYGKANSVVDVVFEDAVNVLNNRMSDNHKVAWIKEKFDILNNN